MTTMIATRDPKLSRMCVMPDGSRETIAAAQTKGFTIADANTARPKPAAPTIAATYTPRPMTFAQLVAALPEASSRPAAAAALADTNTIETLSLNSAAALLRGLPTEQDNATMSNPSTAKLTAADVTNFNRRAELRVAGLTRSGLHGNEAAAVEAKKIKLGLSIVSQTGVSYGSAFASVGLPARETIAAILGVAN
jgi:hypothetical protein